MVIMPMFTQWGDEPQDNQEEPQVGDEESQDGDGVAEIQPGEPPRDEAASGPEPEAADALKAETEATPERPRRRRKVKTG